MYVPPAAGGKFGVFHVLKSFEVLLKLDDTMTAVRQDNFGF